MLKRYFILAIAMITAVAGGTATSTSAMQPQTNSTQSMHTKKLSKKNTNRLEHASSKTSKAVAKSSKSVTKDTGEVVGAGAMAVGKGAKKTGEAPAKLVRKIAHPSKHRSN